MIQNSTAEWRTPALARRTAARLLAVLLLAAFGSGVFACWRSRVDYGTFGFWRLPERIEFCDRRYYKHAASIEWEPTAIAASTSGRSTWATVGHTVSRKPIRALMLSDSSVCTMALYVETGDGRYRPYVLSGGP